MSTVIANRQMVCDADATAASEQSVRAQARHWIEQHHTEMVRLSRYPFRHCDADTREEATAEILASTYQAALSAARRGTLGRLTPRTCVAYGTRQFRSGRRFAGSSSRCPLSEAGRVQRQFRTRSLDAPADTGNGRFIPLAEQLADGDAERPLERVRRDHDYALILASEGVSEKAWLTFAHLARCHGHGRQRELAQALMVSPARITQLKAELAAVLARHGYSGPLAARPSRC